MLSLAVGDVLINEFRRDGQITNTEYVELLLTRDVIAGELETLRIGDSTSSTAAKFGAYQFANLGSIASVFKAGTVIAVGGSTAIPTEDTAYSPAPGNSNDDWNLKLQAGGSFVNNAAGNSMDFAASDVVWIDTSSSGTTSLLSIAWPATGGGAFAAAATARIAAPNNGANVEYLGDGSGYAITGNYSINSGGSLGAPNGGTNTTYVDGLRNSSVPTLTLSVAPPTFPESAGAAAAIGSVTRTGDLTAELIIAISTSDVTEATVPATVTIDAGEDTATFAIDAVDDFAVDGPQTVTITAAATGFAQVAVPVTVTDDDVVLTPIYDIQGPGEISPLLNQVITTEGIVVGDFQGTAGLGGFFLQDQIGDGLQETSDGIFVFVPSANPFASVDVQPGDIIRLTATVREFNTLTELDFVTSLTIIGTAALPAPAVVTLPETTNGELERYEGMIVTIPQTMTVAQNFFQGRYGQVTLAAGGRLYQPTQLFDAGSAEAISLADENARRLLVLDDGRSAQNPDPAPYISPALDNTLRAGDAVAGLVGVLDFGSISSTASVRDYRLQPTAAPVFSRVNERTAAPDVTEGNLKVASFNVLNYFTTFGSRGAGNQEEFDRQKAKIVSAIAAMNADIVGLIEIENNGSTAIDDLVSALNDYVGTGTYAAVPDPAFTGTDAIKVALIYQPARVTPVGGSVSDPDLVHNRPPVAQTFELNANGERLTVVVNHFKSKSAANATGLDLDQRDGQGAYNFTRLLQAQALRNFIDELKLQSGDGDVLVIGDLNAYAQEDPIQVLTAAGLVNQSTRFDPLAYSYVFDGQSGTLDHALATGGLSEQVVDAVEWHINADEPQVIDYDLSFKPASAQALYTPSPYRSSDHDPVIVSLNLAADPEQTVPATQSAEEGSETNFALGSFRDSDGDGPWTVSVNWGDGSPLQSFVVGFPGDLGNLPHTYDDDGSYTLVISIAEREGAGASSEAQSVVEVAGIAPNASVVGPADGVRGQRLSFAVGATDPSTADTAAGFDYFIDWDGDGTIDETIEALADNGYGVVLDHSFTDVGTYETTVFATDKDGQTSPAATVLVTVSAAAIQPDPANPGGSILVVGGTTGNDLLTVSRWLRSDSILVTLNLTPLGLFTGADRIVVHAQAGDDLTTAVNVNVPMVLDGGAGNDLIYAGRGPAVLLGGEGNDALFGSLGADILIGGEGTDFLSGGGGEDILIGGTTSYDRHDTALFSLLAEWSRIGVDYRTRVGHLDGSLAGGLNGALFLSQASVFDDAAIDELFGDSGLDWFFTGSRAGTRDRLRDRWLREIVIELA